MDEIGSATFSWWDFKVWVSHRPPGSILHTKVHGEHYPFWVQMLGLAIDLLQSANHQRSGSRVRPKRIRWPWANRDDTQSFGKAAPLEHIRDFLMFRNGRVPGR